MVLYFVAIFSLLIGVLGMCYFGISVAGVSVAVGSLVFWAGLFIYMEPYDRRIEEVHAKIEKRKARRKGNTDEESPAAPKSWSKTFIIIISCLPLMVFFCGFMNPFSAEELVELNPIHLMIWRGLLKSCFFIGPILFIFSSCFLIATRPSDTAKGWMVK